VGAHRFVSLVSNMEQAFLNQYVPYSQEAEEAVIGAVIINPASFYSVAAFLNAEDFFILRHQHVWNALLRLNERSDEIDYISVVQELKNLDKLDEIGGQAYITQLINNTPTSIHAEVYGRLVERAAIRRRLLSAADRIKMLALDEQLTVERVMDAAETELFGVSERQLSRELIPMREALSQYYDLIEGLMQATGDPLGLPTGFNDLDKLLGGLQRSDLMVFAGRPGMGKSSFLLSVALNVARLGRRVLIFTMEMAVDQIVQRLVSMESAINTQKLRTGQLSPQEWAKFVQAVDNLSNLRIFIDDTPAMTPLQMRSKCFRLAREHGVDLVILDYMQLMNGGGTYENNRVQEISYISRSMKELARELNVPIMSAAQLSRAVEQRQDKRPVLSDLRESGSIEQDSDIVMFLYRDEVYNEATEFPNQAEVIVSKHRNGPTGTISLYFDKTLTKFLNAAARNIDLSHI
jgi:replicative DNA helicase